MIDEIQEFSESNVPPNVVTQRITVLYLFKMNYKLFI